MKVVIIGGVAAGPKTAARLRRLMPDAEITVIEQGDVISYGSCGLPLYIGNLVPDIMDLMTTSSGSVRDREFFADTKNVKVLNNTRAEAINREKKSARIHNLISGQQEDFSYDYLVLATGAKPVVPNIPGKDLPGVFSLHHPQDAQAIRELVRVKKIKHVTIIGAGLIGMEVADALAGPRLKVTICEALPQILPKLLDADMAAMVERQVRAKGVEIFLGSAVQSLIAGEDGAVAKVKTATGEIDTEAVILAIGMRPAVELARDAGLSIGITGAIKVNSQLQTDDPYIYAGGDCVENLDLITGEPIYSPLASTANKHGRVIANNIAGQTTVFPGVNKTSVLQCFDYNIGRTGLGEDEAIHKGFETSTVLISGYDATHYFPMHDKVKVKLIAEKKSGKILGAQVLGEGEVIKRLDVLVTAMKYGADLEDVASLDLGYAPPFSTAIDLVAHAANALQNKIKGLVPSVSTQELMMMLQNKESFQFLDIRTWDEIQNKPISYENKIEIPLNELNKRWPDLPANQKLITVCELGIRGFEAACLLKGKGMSNVFFLEGGVSALASD
ncbi:FAD-dependent oxidoreductase [Dehalobacter sp. DCM]|uniref:FAD-dependent oxidoreductase n=1 Tax=Dehalobacter sp. DCM TaxID=2907827 RepID=UPI0030817C22|nr:FAD-dependent oxidoreductase [Dehalobacter sp. DCM]